MKQLPLIFLVCLGLSSITSCSAETDDSNTGVMETRLVTAPLNHTLHYGNMNGVKIAIPPKYWASVIVQSRDALTSCGAALTQFNCQILDISLYLRYPSFDPIYTQQDLAEWHSNFMRPFDKQGTGQHWISMGYRGDIYKNTQGNLGAFYQRHYEQATKSFGHFSCDTKYELKHCATKKQVFPGRVNEFYFDEKTGGTLIECKRFAEPNGKLLSCLYYAVIPEIHAVAEMGMSSEYEISRWRSFNKAFEDVAVKLIAQ
jgi:hypothetical protein